MTINISRYLLILILFFTISSNGIAAKTPDSTKYNKIIQNSLNLTQEEINWLKNHSTISLAYDGHFPPYSFLNDKNEFEGFAIDVFYLISQRLGVTFKLHPDTTWKELYNAARDRDVDVVATMVKRPEREAWFNFTDPYVFKSLAVIAREDEERIQQRDDLSGKKVALVTGYQYVESILKEFPSITPHYVDTMLDGLNAVSTGKADAAITYLGGGHFLRTKYLLNNLKFVAIYDRKSSLESIAVRKDWPLLSSILNKALKSIPQSQMHELLAKWLPVDFIESQVKIDLTEKEKEWIRQHPTIHLGIDPEFAPFEYMDNGKYSGIASDYIKLLNQRLGLNMQVVKGLSWEQAVNKARNKEVDVLPIVGMTEERKQFLNYSKSYIDFHRVLITRTDTPFITGLDDVRDLRIAVQSNTSHEGYLREHTNIKPIGYDTLSKSLMALSGGEVDAFVANVASATYWIRKLNLTNLKIAAPVSQDLQSLHFAVRNDWPELNNMLQKGLDSISDRQRRKISEKWLLLEYDPVTDYGLVIKVVITFSLLLLAILLWNILLNKKVKQRTSELMYHAHYDQLTDLPNRFLILDRLSQLINESHIDNSMVAVLSIDLDDFKKINDSLTHSAGDALLKETASRLKNILRESDTLGRTGGDEFVVLLGRLADASATASVIESLLSSFRNTFSLGDRELTITASMGVAIFPDDGNTAEILLKNADSAMHHSKVLGRDTYAFYTKELNQQVARRLQIEEHMHGALERNEFVTFYQPKLDVDTREITGFEALLRWYSPELGEVSPVEFIPIAENNSLIVPIGLFALQTALKAAAKWQQQFKQGLTIAVNLSPRQFLSKDLLLDIKEAITNTGVTSNTLELEITEGILLSGNLETENIFDELKKLGVLLAMDDFGTGYSSMSYLRKYTFDTLKIDREFINDLTRDKSNRQLVSATIAMAHNLEMKVVAEGVETEDQLSILVEENCDLVQGFLFSKPVREEQIAHMLGQQKIGITS